MRAILLLVFCSIVQYISAQSKNLEEFTKIKTAAGVKVELYKSDTHKAEYTIHKGSEEDLVIEVKNATLTVKIKSNNGIFNRSQTSATVKVYAKEINSFDCSSGSSLKSDEVWKAEELSAEVSSGASCRIEIISTSLRADASSGSKLTLSGSVGKSRMEASSGAKIDALDLISNNAEADVSSGGNITLYASESIKAEASSGGTIKYKGNPEKKRIDSGMSGNIKAI